MTNSPAPPKRLAGSLGTATLAFMVLAASAPLTFLAGGAPLGILLGNGAGFPAMFVVGVIVLLFFSVGFTTMTQYVTKPGAFFTYVSNGLGAEWGVGTAYLALVVYSAVNIGVHALTGAVLAQTFVALGGVELPWWIWSLLSVLIVGVLGYQRIDVGSTILAVLLIGELLIISAVIVAVVVTNAHGNGLNLQPFTGSHVFSGSFGVGLTLAMSAFIGFEAVAVFRDEARTPERTVPRATYLAVVGIGAFYALATWAIVMGWGIDKILAETGSDPGTLLLRTAGSYLGGVGEGIMNTLLITSLFACTLSLHNIITRYLHSIAFAGLAAGWMAAVHNRNGSPYLSSLFQTATAAAMMVLCAILKLDPLLQTIAWTSGIATLGVALLMVLTSLAVIAFFARDHRNVSVNKRLVAPVLGLAGLLVVTVMMTMNFPLLVGDADAGGNPAFGPLSYVLLAVTVLPLAFGALHVVMLRRSRSDAYGRFLTNFVG